MNKMPVKRDNILSLVSRHLVSREQEGKGMANIKEKRIT